MGFLEHHSDHKALMLEKLKFLIGVAFVMIAASCFGQVADSVRLTKKNFNRVGFSGSLTVNKQGDEESLPMAFFGTFKHYLAPNFAVGAGIGLMDTYWQFDQIQYFPLFGVIQGDAGVGDHKLIGFLHTGYNFATTGDEQPDEWFRREYRGGWMWNLGGGLLFKVKDVRLSATLGYRFFKGSIKDIFLQNTVPEYITEFKRSFNRVELSFGMEI